jgi:AraC-like DNA-binding protein
MSNFRQDPVPEIEPIVRSLGVSLPCGHRFPEHEHDWAQLIYPAHGVLVVEAANTQWVVPPLRCLWIPAGIRHRVETIGDVGMRTVYLRPERTGDLATTLRVLDVSPLMRELLIEIVRLGALRIENDDHRSLECLILAQARNATPLGLVLTLPVDPRARIVADRVCHALRAGGEDHQTLAEFTRGSGASPRTAERLRETGMSFGRWRQQARLQFAVRRLGEGADVTTVALECGYQSVSAFVTMFRRSLGSTPGQYGLIQKPASPISNRPSQKQRRRVLENGRGV